MCWFVLLNCEKGKSNDESCNGDSTRREVKICTDSEADSIKLTPIEITVKAFGEIAVDEVSKKDKRQPLEYNIYTITAKVHKLSYHRDGDWKVKLTDGEDRFVNCENPNPNCEFAIHSRFHNNYKTVRTWINENKDDLEGKTVTITGVGFIDIDHKYPRNAALNEMELHPILEISY
jgi:hypothetical protein